MQRKSKIRFSILSPKYKVTLLTLRVYILLTENAMVNQQCSNPSYKLKALVIGVILFLGVAAKNGYLGEKLLSDSEVKTSKSVSFNSSAE